MRQVETTHTTPDAITINKLLHEMVLTGCEYAFMEVSSHAIDQQRVCGLLFTGALFSNISRDHLDYHKTFANYLKVKQSFFDSLPSSSFALTNIDDKNGDVIVQHTKAKLYTYSLRILTDFKVKIFESHLDGMLLQLNSKEIAVQFEWRVQCIQYPSSNTAIILGQNENEVLVA